MKEFVLNYKEEVKYGGRSHKPLFSLFITSVNNIYRKNKDFPTVLKLMFSFWVCKILKENLPFLMMSGAGMWALHLSGAVGLGWGPCGLGLLPTDVITWEVWKLWVFVVLFENIQSKEGAITKGECCRCHKKLA